jgi:hypothetical protein
VFVHWVLGTESLAPCPTPFLWGKFSIPPAYSTIGVWLQFTVCLFVFHFCKAVRFWMLLSGSGEQALWSTTCPTLGGGLLPVCSQPSLPFLCLFTESLALRA